MRPVIVTDLVCAGRAVLAAAPTARIRTAKALLDNANGADRARLSTGTLHPDFGDGTLADAARKMGLAPEPPVCDPDFARAMILVLQALVARSDSD